ncbi:hypothetical protein DPMN_040272 [Dreissena polymorpha]|uniref:Uncharacterized protein n=1 Tax=Dreissena polymorpha TaxID=45954 RepID=A0A9D4CWV2_DREPO|nr:hypothetical protein DPMN_040272 [Dreissena polymorpha]
MNPWLFIWNPFDSNGHSVGRSTLGSLYGTHSTLTDKAWVDQPWLFIWNTFDSNGHSVGRSTLAHHMEHIRL